MKKQLKEYGTTLVISFTKEEQRVYNLKPGDILDLTDMIIVKEKKK